MGLVMNLPVNTVVVSVCPFAVRSLILSIHSNVNATNHAMLQVHHSGPLVCLANMAELQGLIAWFILGCASCFIPADLAGKKERIHVGNYIGLQFGDGML